MTAPPLALALVSVTIMAIVAFGIGFAFGRDAGMQRARQIVHDRLLDYSQLALHGHVQWRSISVATALQRAASLLGKSRR